MERLYRALEIYSQEDYYPFHMPGHKRNPDTVNTDLPFDRDITEIEGFDNLHHPEGILKKAQETAANVYGTKECYYSVNGSTAALLAAVSAAVPRKGQILVARNCHKAVYHALYLRNLIPTYVYPQMDQKWWINGGISPDKVERALAENLEIKAVLLTSPTYDGVVSDIEKIAEIVKGVAEGCVQSEAALIGGETAEHPGLMPEDEYDLAGFAVGVVDKKDLLTGEALKPGDVLIGMASTGVHSNGFSLVRKVFDMTKESLDTYYDELGTTLGEALLAPTRIYVKALKSIKNAGVRVHACSHITGGGFYENIPRMLKEGTRAVVEKNSYPVLPIFKLLAEKGNIDEQMMYNTYNMGLGMILAVDAADVDKTMEAIKAAGDTPYVVGRIEDGEKGVTLC